VPSPDTDGSPSSREETALGPLSRLLFAVIGLITGDAVLPFYLLWNALRVRSALLNAHMGEPYRALPQAWESFSLYAIFSVVGWLLVGVPIALALPAAFVSRMVWVNRVLIGIVLGPLALLLIFLMLFAIQGRMGAFSLAHSGSLWPLAMLVSTISFVAYATLVRRRVLRNQQ
jgi:hypothetical protein